MKRALRILVPLALIVAVIISAAWYLLVYDREFTRDMLLTQARYSESAGYHKFAATLYNLAYEHASKDEDVAIELARQYEKAGNYTKAEFTLYNAISDGPSAKLYAERSRIFVAQDKLKDAVVMLDTIGKDGSAIGMELQQMRPAVPTADYPEGVHNDYISVTLRCENGTVYATTDGTYPTTANGPCTQPIQLPKGVTTIAAVTVDANGLVSSVEYLTYVIGGIIEPVTFADPAVEEILRQHLPDSQAEVIYSDQLWDIHVLNMPATATSYADLALLPYLTNLTIENGRADQLYHLANVTSLQELTLVNTYVSEETTTMIAKLPELTRLTMARCSLSTLKPLAGAANLEYLDVTSNNLRDLSPLAGCQNLQELYLTQNHVDDLSSLTMLTQLRVLDVAYNSLSSIDPICTVPSIEVLNVGYNYITSLGSIHDLAMLTSLNCQSNRITSIEGVQRCTMLQELNIAGNQVVDILPLGSLTQLTYLNFASNLVSQLPDFSKELPLVTIDGSSNLLSDLTALAGLPQLNNVLMKNNTQLTTVEPLKQCHKLIKVDLDGTKVSQVDFLTSQGVIVIYDPTLKSD